MLAASTTTRTTPRPFIIAPIRKSVFAKVATSGTPTAPKYELVRVLIDQPSALGWHEVQSANGSRWYCHREDMRQLFPIFGA